MQGKPDHQSPEYQLTRPCCPSAATRLRVWIFQLTRMLEQKILPTATAGLMPQVSYAAPTKQECAPCKGLQGFHPPKGDPRDEDMRAWGR